MGEMRMAGTTPGGKRETLRDQLPLDTPFSIQIFPSYACNFRCNFCLHALERKQHGFISDKIFMDIGAYRKYIDDIRLFPRKLKMLRFAAIGEPLLHKNIVDMVAYAKQADIAESVDIVTNGALLTPELSDGLIEAGLDRLRISVNGLSAEEFMENTRARVDFEQFTAQIAYFYRASVHTHVYIKIIDYMVQTADRRKRFFDTFQPICHSIAVEHLTPTVEGIDYDALSDGLPADQVQNGGALLHSEICPQPFYMMQINPDGKVVPCCSMRYPVVLGNASEQSIPDIWNGPDFNQFRRNLLRSRTQASPVCGSCRLYLYGLHPEDILDGAAERLAAEYTAP